MRVQTVRDLGLATRRARETAGLAQADLASSVGVSRQWLSAFETGKPNIDLGLVLRVLDRLGLRLEVSLQVSVADPSSAPSLAVAATEVNLDELLDAYRARS